MLSSNNIQKSTQWITLRDLVAFVQFKKHEK